MCMRTPHACHMHVHATPATFPAGTATGLYCTCSMRCIHPTGGWSHPHNNTPHSLSSQSGVQSSSRVDTQTPTAAAELFCGPRGEQWQEHGQQQLQKQSRQQQQLGTQQQQLVQQPCHSRGLISADKDSGASTSGTAGGTLSSARCTLRSQRVGGDEQSAAAARIRRSASDSAVSCTAAGAGTSMGGTGGGGSGSGAAARPPSPPKWAAGTAAALAGLPASAVAAASSAAAADLLTGLQLGHAGRVTVSHSQSASAAAAAAAVLKKAGKSDAAAPLLSVAAAAGGDPSFNSPKRVSSSSSSRRASSSAFAPALPQGCFLVVDEDLWSATEAAAEVAAWQLSSHRPNMHEKPSGSCCSCTASTTAGIGDSKASVLHPARTHRRSFTGPTGSGGQREVTSSTASRRAFSALPKHGASNQSSGRCTQLRPAPSREEQQRLTEQRRLNALQYHQQQEGQQRKQHWEQPHQQQQQEQQQRRDGSRPFVPPLALGRLPLRTPRPAGRTSNSRRTPTSAKAAQGTHHLHRDGTGRSTGTAAGAVGGVEWDEKALHDVGGADSLVGWPPASALQLLDQIAATNDEGLMVPPGASLPAGASAPAIVPSLRFATAQAAQSASAAATPAVRGSSASYTAAPAAPSVQQLETGRSQRVRTARGADGGAFQLDVCCSMQVSRPPTQRECQQTSRR